MLCLRSQERALERRTLCFSAMVFSLLDLGMSNYDVNHWLRPRSDFPSVEQYLLQLKHVSLRGAIIIRWLISHQAHHSLNNEFFSLQICQSFPLQTFLKYKWYHLLSCLQNYLIRQCLYVGNPKLLLWKVAQTWQFTFREPSRIQVWSWNFLRFLVLASVYKHWLS